MVTWITGHVTFLANDMFAINAVSSDEACILDRRTVLAANKTMTFWIGPHTISCALYNWLWTCRM